MDNFAYMITIYDTATGSLNIGDTIIMEAAMTELEKMFSYGHFVHYPTHYALARSTLKKAWKNAKLKSELERNSVSLSDDEESFEKIYQSYIEYLYLNHK